MQWTEFRPDCAQWMDEAWSNEEWLEAHPNRHPLFKLPGVGIQTVQPDLLHTKHFGVDVCLFGSALHVLVYTVLEGTANRVNECMTQLTQSLLI